MKDIVAAEETRSAYELPRRTLCAGGPTISVIGLGAAALGGEAGAVSWGPQDDAASMTAMRRAIDLGINWIDTAAAYGLGHSETVIGRFLRDLPSADRPLIFTKCGLIWDAWDRKVTVRNLQPASIRTECDASLHRLGVEQIDLFQFHWPDETGTPVEDSWGEMGRLIDEGKVRFGGVSNFNVSLLQRCENVRHVDSLQGPLSLIRRELASEQIPWCIANDTGVLCYSPMQSGLLTDTFEAQRLTSLSRRDWRHTLPHFREPDLSANLALRDALRPIAQRHGTTVASIAVAWVIATPGVTGAVVGARSAEQVEAWIGAAKVQLEQEDIDLVAAAVNVRTAEQTNRS